MPLLIFFNLFAFLTVFYPKSLLSLDEFTVFKGNAWWLIEPGLAGQWVQPLERTRSPGSSLRTAAASVFPSVRRGVGGMADFQAHQPSPPPAWHRLWIKKWNVSVKKINPKWHKIWGLIYSTYIPHEDESSDYNFRHKERKKKSFSLCSSLYRKGSLFNKLLKILIPVHGLSIITYMHF